MPRARLVVLAVVLAGFSILLQAFHLRGRPTSIQAVDDAGNVGPVFRIG